jgi:hypothetical protein
MIAKIGYGHLCCWGRWTLVLIILIVTLRIHWL